ILRLVPQNFHRHPNVESPPLRLCLGNHVRLKWREIMRQTRHGGRHRPQMLQLRQHEINRHRQARRRQQLIFDLQHQLLHRHILRQALPEGFEEISLFDIFLAVEHGKSGGTEDHLFPKSLWDTRPSRLRLACFRHYTHRSPPSAPSAEIPILDPDFDTAFGHVSKREPSRRKSLFINALWNLLYQNQCSFHDFMIQPPSGLCMHKLTINLWLNSTSQRTLCVTLHVLLQLSLQRTSPALPANKSAICVMNSIPPDSS